MENPRKTLANTAKIFHVTHLPIPAISSYLISFKDRRGKGKGLFVRDDQGDYWWELRACDYYPEFEKEKIVWDRITDIVGFSYIHRQYYLLDSTFFITGIDLKYIIGILNSTVSIFWMKNTVATTLGKGMYGAKIYIEKLPIPRITAQNQEITNK
ncbi:MAG: TaqI-like C-terminal specificity domain-containing protein [Fervidobacterium sp.]